MNNNNLFMYKRRLQDESSLNKVQKKNNRDICIAGVLTNNQLNFGVAVCGKKEQFVKSLARKIASGRAEKKPVMTVDASNIPEKELGKFFVEHANSFLNTL